MTTGVTEGQTPGQRSAPLAGLTVSRQSTLYFSYPFVFSRSSYASLVSRSAQATTSVWRDAETNGRRAHVPMWDPDPMKSARDYLLPHLSRHVNPEAELTPGTDPAGAAYFWSMSNTGLQLLNRGRPLVALRGGSWRLVPPNRPPITFEIESVRLSVFSAGSGSLTLEVRPGSKSLADWVDFNYHFSKLRGAKVQVVPGDEGPAVATGTENLRAYDVVAAVLGTGIPADGDTVGAQWWEGIFVPHQFVPFTCLFVAEEMTAMLESDLCHRIRFGHSGRQVVNPYLAQLHDEGSAVLPYSDTSRFVFSIEGGGFVAGAAPKDQFWTSTLPDHLRDHYLLAMLIVLAQRTALMRISKTVADSWSDDDPDLSRRETFDQIVDDLLEFTARLQFVQIFQTEHYHAAYIHFRRAFHIEELYREVGDEVSQMATRAESNAEKKRDEAETREARDRDVVEFAVFFVTLVVLPSQVFLALFVNKLDGWPWLKHLGASSSQWITVAIMTALILWAMWLAWSRRRRRAAHRR